MEFQELLSRKRIEYGAKFDATDLDTRFAPYFRTGQRIQVETSRVVVTGTVGVTTGWKPVFLLMRTRRSIGSVWTLGKGDRILAVKRGAKYQPLE